MQPPPPPPPPSRHSLFFSSLKQVEKRLKLEHPSSHPPNPSPQEIDSLISPIFVHSYQPTTTNKHSSLQESSEPPLEFLSPSSSPQQFPHTQFRSSFEENLQIGSKDNDDDDDGIECLIRILGLSEEEEKQRKSGSFGYEDGFYEQIVGVKGPKCRDEVERLEGWIKYFSNGGDGGEKRKGKGSLEPLRLAFLLMGKAAFLSEDSDGGGLEFPSAIEEFLKIDPPKD